MEWSRSCSDLTVCCDLHRLLYHLVTMLQNDLELPDQRLGELIHLLNNLLAVIQTQVDVARASSAEGAAASALGMIERTTVKVTSELAVIRAGMR